jgi:hypothetical protein
VKTVEYSIKKCLNYFVIGHKDDAGELNSSFSDCLKTKSDYTIGIKVALAHPAESRLSDNSISGQKHVKK